MEIIQKIIDHGKAYALAAKKEFDAIQSPAIRLGIMIAVFLIALGLAVKALPLLILFAVIAVGIILLASILDDDDSIPR